MIYIEVDSVYCYIYNTTYDLFKDLTNHLYRMSLSSLSPSTPQHMKTGSSFYRKSAKGHDYCYRGFLPDILSFLESKKIPYEVKDKTISNTELVLPSNEDLENIITLSLRDYQILCVRRILQDKFGYLHLATGAGKTVIAGAFLKYWQDKIFPKGEGGNALFVVNTKHLVDQTLSNFKRYGLLNVVEFDIDMFEDYKKGGHIIVTTIQKLFSKKSKSSKKSLSSFYDSVKVLFLDECHHQSATTWRDLVRSCNKVHYRIGLTATPYKTLTGESYEDGFVIGLLGRPLVYVPYHYLRDKGYLSDLRVCITSVVRKLPLPNIEIPTSGSGWMESYREGIVYNTFMYTALYQILQRHKDKRILILTYLVEHAKLVKRFVDSLEFVKSPVVLITSKESDVTSSPTSYLNKLDSFVVVTTTVFDEGIDLPELDIVVMLTGMKSVIKSIQRIGRGSRKTEDKSVSYCYDFWPTFDRLLQEHFQKRLEVYTKEFLKIEYSDLPLSEDTPEYTETVKILSKLDIMNITC